MVDDPFGSVLADLADLVGMNDAVSNRKVVDAIWCRDPYELCYDDGSHLLHQAVAHGNEPVVQYLVGTKGVHVNLADRQGRTPLYIASEAGSRDMVTLLQNHHADPRIRVPDEVTRDHIVSYRYRVYREWLANLDHFVWNRSTHTRTPPFPDAEERFRKAGLQGLSERCDAFYGAYLKAVTLRRAGTLNPIPCLLCGKPDDTERCFNCRAVWFCSNSCEKTAHRHHQHDCYQSG